MRFFLEIILSIVVVWQYTTIRNYQLEIEQLSGELNFLLDNQRGLLLCSTNSKTIQKLISLQLNEYITNALIKKKGRLSENEDRNYMNDDKFSS